MLGAVSAALPVHLTRVPTPLTGLNAAWGRWKALLGMAVAYGVMHLLAYSESGMQSATLALAILLAMLFGILFGLVRLQTGTLWMPTALHFTWNFLETDVLNLTGDIHNVNLVGAITRLQPPDNELDQLWQHCYSRIWRISHHCWLLVVFEPKKRKEPKAESSLAWS
jgi:membrane protease YdiL (CAAX protease family)